MKQVLVLLTFVVFIVSCTEEPVSLPKPRAYPRIIFPEKTYQQFDTGFCQFTFEYPKYASIEQDTTYFDQKAPNSCWFNIIVPQLGSYIYCTYYPLGKENTFDEVVKDAYDFADKHNIKANYIDELPIRKPGNVSGMIFNIEGPVASNFQFFLTDSTKHFLRAALYFKTQAKPDSLAPVLEFMKEDIVHMINTFEWKK